MQCSQINNESKLKTIDQYIKAQKDYNSESRLIYH